MYRYIHIYIHIYIYIYTCIDLRQGDLPPWLRIRPVGGVEAVLGHRRNDKKKKNTSNINNNIVLYFVIIIIIIIMISSSSSSSGRESRQTWATGGWQPLGTSFGVPT